MNPEKIPPGKTAILQALRAGPIEAGELFDRVGSSFSSAARQLVAAGLVEVARGLYRITPAGRAACPMRNPHLEKERTA